MPIRGVGWHPDRVHALANQLPALIGVLLGTVATVAGSVVTDRVRWSRDRQVRWDDRRMDAYAEYARAVKAVHALALRVNAGRRPGASGPWADPEHGLAQLAEAERQRTVAWEAVLLLGDEASVSAAGDWREAVGDMAALARDPSPPPEQWSAAVRAADERRDAFYTAARAGLAVSGGSVAQAGRLRSAAER